MSALIRAQGLTKSYGATRALDRVDLEVEAGRIVGLIGPNGAGKTTALKAILGLTPFQGELQVLGLDPYRQRSRLMEQVCFIADVAVLPRWLRVRQAIELVAATHPRFQRQRALELLGHTEIRLEHRVKQLSKGMVVQLHLALVMAIDVKLLILDEPTLGLDLLARRDFYDALLGDYFDEQRTIIITTHQVEEVERILTDVVFMNHGRIVLDQPMDVVAESYVELLVNPDQSEAARSLGPIHEREVFGKHLLLYEGVSREQLGELGELHTPSIADLFVAKIRGAAA